MSHSDVCIKIPHRVELHTWEKMSFNWSLNKPPTFATMDHLHSYSRASRIGIYSSWLASIFYYFPEILCRLVPQAFKLQTKQNIPEKCLHRSTHAAIQNFTYWNVITT